MTAKARRTSSLARAGTVPTAVTVMAAPTIAAMNFRDIDLLLLIGFTLRHLGRRCSDNLGAHRADRQYRGRDIGYHRRHRRFVIVYLLPGTQIWVMKNCSIIVGFLAAALLANGALAAECYADYKAKQDDPLRLHYGVAQVSQCSKRTAEAELAKRLAKRGWTLLNVMSVFDENGLAERKESAGPNYLRY